MLSIRKQLSGCMCVCVMNADVKHLSACFILARGCKKQLNVVEWGQMFVKGQASAVLQKRKGKSEGDSRELIFEIFKFVALYFEELFLKKYRFEWWSQKQMKVGIWRWEGIFLRNIARLGTIGKHMICDIICVFSKRRNLRQSIMNVKKRIILFRVLCINMFSC